MSEAAPDGPPLLGAVLDTGHVMVGEVEDFNEEKLVFSRCIMLPTDGQPVIPRVEGPRYGGWIGEVVAARVEINRRHLAFTIEVSRAGWGRALQSEPSSSDESPLSALAIRGMGVLTPEQISAQRRALGIARGEEEEP